MLESEERLNSVSGGQVVVEINVEHPQHHDELEVLDSKIAELTRPDQGGDKLASSNLGSGLQEALRLFGEADDTMAKNSTLR